MKLPAPTTAILIALAVPSLTRAQTPDLASRLNQAEDYLRIFQVPYKEDRLEPSHRDELMKAFEEWRKGQGDDSARMDAPPPKLLSPSVAERIARLSSFKTDWAQTPEYVSAIPEGSRPGTPAQIVRNPNYALWSFGGTISPSELYVSIQDRTSMCDAIETLWKMPESEGGNPADYMHCLEADFLSASRPRDGWGRLAAAMTLTITGNQVPRFQSGVIASAATIERGRDYTYTFQGSFDPSLMFRTAAEWGAWGDFYNKKGHKFIGQQRGFRPRECGGPVPDLNIAEHEGNAESDQSEQTGMKHAIVTDACIDRLARGPKYQQFVTTILPKVDVKAFTAFDFLKTGLNTFVPTPASGRALYDITGTWDLRKLFPSAQARVQALKAAKGLTEGPKKDDSDKNKLAAGWKAQLEMMYIDLLEEPGLAGEDAWWKHFHEFVEMHLKANTEDSGG